ncbi:unnamed protein product, partial [Callosobruchus maculatus]
MHSEEEVENLLKEIDGNSEEVQITNLGTVENAENAEKTEGVLKSTESNMNIELDCGINETNKGIETQQIHEERIICNECSTVLPLDENVDHRGICLNCRRQENICNARKKSRESLGKQAGKMLKLSNNTFSEVQV